MTSHHIALSGGSAKTKYSASLSYLNQQGTIIESAYESLKARLTLDQQINDKVKFGASINFANNVSTGSAPSEGGGQSTQYFLYQVLAYRPVKYKSTDAYKNLPSVQYEILCASSKFLKHGGVLVYSTCTLNRAENETNIERFLLENKDFEPYDFELGDIKSKGGAYTFFPHITETDGFFVARLRKKDE